MNRLSMSLATFLLLSVNACSSSNGSNGATSSADDAGALDDAGLTSDEMTSFTSSGDSLVAQQETATLADELFDFDPTIDPTASPSANATSIGGNIQTGLGSSCGTVSVSGTTVSVAFGAAPGCTLADGVQVSGSVSLGVSQSGATTSIALTFDDTIVNGEALTGQSTFSTTNGSTFAVTSSLTSDGETHTSTLTVTGGTNSFIISGNATVTEDAGTTSIVFTDVTHVKGECYATSGTMAVSKGLTTETLTFNAQTPVTGEVTVQTGKHSTNLTLPAYGDCPSDAVDGGRR